MKPWTEVPPVTEAQFLRQVIDLARLLGWREYHPALSKWSAAGWPDLALLRPPQFILAELKRDNGKLSTVQGEWLDLLRRCPGVEVCLWRPGDFDQIAAVLRR